MRLVKRIGVRLAVFAASLFVASFLVFWVCQALPGDVANVILGTNADPASVAQLRTKLGLDRPFLLRYLEWATGMLTGNFGHSYLNSASVTSLIAPRLAVTLWLVFGGMLVAIIVAVPVGMAAAVKRRHWQGQLLSALSQLGMAIPAFLAGILLVVVFAIRLRWLPANGYVDMRKNILEWARHLVLPILSLGLVQGSVLTRYVRATTVEILGEDYLRTARAVGWRLWPALLRHGLRNMALNLVTVIGLQLATLLVGAIVIEQVFQLPGLGQLLLTAVTSRDLAIVQGVVMLLVASVLIVNALVDMAYVLIDPRLRAGDKS
ncbi:MAG: ABC transporter permease [Propionibacteriaceae bacterium]